MIEPPIIVGSGAAGTAAALALSDKGVRPIMLDVGHRPLTSSPVVPGNLYDFREEEDTFCLFVGRNYFGLSDILTQRQGIAKLNTPYAEFVTRGATALSPFNSKLFEPVQSFARGGLGNVWGAGLYRFVNTDVSDFPFGVGELERYFDRLTSEIGISGEDDDLAEFFGSTSGLQPSLSLSHNASCFYANYRQRKRIFNRAGVFVGRPRLGVLSSPRDGREPCNYSNAEFWQESSYVYTPTKTLNRLIAESLVDYRPGHLVRMWREDQVGVTVEAVDLESQSAVQVRGSCLILAAGAIGTTKIVLRAFECYEQTLPLFENPGVIVPFVLPGSIGRPLDTHAFGLTQLNLVWNTREHGRTQASFLEVTAPMRSEFYSRFPLPARSSLIFMRKVLPAMLVMQLYYPGSSQLPASIKLRSDGELFIEGHENPIRFRDLSSLFRLLFSAGLWTLPLLAVRTPMGHSVHYAGSLPMVARPVRLQCWPNGRLADTSRVFVGDSAGFPSLPSKNMSLGMMANAMRVAEMSLQSVEVP